MVYSIVKLELFACHSLVDFLDKLSTDFFGRLWTIVGKCLLLLSSVRFTVRNSCRQNDYTVGGGRRKHTRTRIHVRILRVTPMTEVRLLTGAYIIYLFWEWPGDRGRVPSPAYIHRSIHRSGEFNRHPATNTSSHSATRMRGRGRVIEGADRVSVMRRRTSAMRQPFTHINRHRYLSLTIAN